MSGFKTPFAYDEHGNLVDYSTAIRGVEYKCHCGSMVKIRGGEKVSNHFYHFENSNCSPESAIHKAYKHIFQKLKKIRLPYGAFDEFWEFDRVELEKGFGDIIADAVGYMGDKPYLIEFANTHEIDKRKQKKLEKLNLPCLEVFIKGIPPFEKDIVKGLIEDKHSKSLAWDPRLKDIVNLEKEIISLKRENKETRQKFINAYEELKEENDKLKRDIHRINLLGPNPKITTLHREKICANGAIMYGCYLPNNNRVVAFLDPDYKKMNVKRN